eukprot:CAMPEP_0174977778 /NCGR_PEP_ID=MMETSP0004_2-20121128/13798_1 /TAXON_ID=420556 /ORGANISM="Ochromonas sp., Strain CCMP1393" /LENGTH=80 /DNA_ID=CAMNT_0016228999 /DNA_START=100 /DNA_END=342 /DNA_ORIENTATION=-
MSMKAWNVDTIKHVRVAGTMAILAPAAAHADGTSFVAFPIVISILTMVPFIYYTQALKPKERTVKQIELDEYNREVKKKK